MEILEERRQYNEKNGLETMIQVVTQESFKRRAKKRNADFTRNKNMTFNELIRE